MTRPSMITLAVTGTALRPGASHGVTVPGLAARTATARAGLWAAENLLVAPTVENTACKK